MLSDSNDSNDVLLLPPFVLNHTGFPFFTSVGKDRKDRKENKKKGKDHHKGHKGEGGKKRHHSSCSRKSDDTLPPPRTEEWMDEVFLAELESYDQRHAQVCSATG